MAFKLFSPDVLHTEPLRYDLVYADTTVQRERTILTKSGRRLPVMMNTCKIEDNVLQAIFHDVSQLRAHGVRKNAGNRLQNHFPHSHY
ncbi:MAG: hypothetical protein ACOCZA_11385 [Spirochaetota bacterium]